MVHSIAPKAEYNRAGCMELPAPENGSIKCLSNGRQCDFKTGFEILIQDHLIGSSLITPTLSDWPPDFKRL